MEQLVLVARTQPYPIPCVHESLREFLEGDRGGESVFGEPDGLDAWIVLFNFRSAVTSMIGMRECRNLVGFGR